MHGYQLSFFTQQDRRHRGLPLGEWILQEARRLGVPGGTLITASEGFGHDRKLRSVHFLELTDQPVEVTLAVNAADADRLLARLREEQINVFCVKTPIEFGMSAEL